MNITCTRRIEFDAAHRVIGHESKCKYLHGHRYVLLITFAANSLDSIGRVIDFGKVKEIVSNWIDEYWDHNLILSEEDKELGLYTENYTGQKIYYLPYNPTVENLAQYLMKDIMPQLFKDKNVVITEIKLYETPNCSAEVR